MTNLKKLQILSYNETLSEGCLPISLDDNVDRLEDLQIKQFQEMFGSEVWDNMQRDQPRLLEKVVRFIAIQPNNLTLAQIQQLKRKFQVKDLLPIMEYPKRHHFLGNHLNQTQNRSILRRSQNHKSSDIAMPKTESRTQRSKIDHPSFAIRARFLAGEILSKETMVLRTLARIINQTYASRSVELKETGDENTISMCEYIYDMLLQRYGLNKVAERKFVSVLSACLFL